MPPRRRRIQVNPAIVPMPNFASNGYAPSRARKRRQLNCTNQEAIQVLTEEWIARQQADIELWREQQGNDIQLQQQPSNNPPQELASSQPIVQLPPIQSQQQPQPDEQLLQPQQQQQQQQQTRLENLVDVLQHQQSATADDLPNAAVNPGHSVPNPSPPQALPNHPSTTELTPSRTPHPNWEEQLIRIVHRLQQAANPTNTTEDADQNLINLDNASPASTPSSATTSLSKIKLGHNVHDVMHEFHLLPLPVLEELRHMRHVKLWFFTNEGIEKTQQAKDKTGRYNTSRVRFDFDKQSLVTENEYEATMKTAPEDNKLSPDQLNQSMPRFLDSIKHANWPPEVVNMFSTFFDDVQRHYEA